MVSSANVPAGTLPGVRAYAQDLGVRKNILVVDPDGIHSRILEVHLRSAGFRVALSQTAADALRSAATSSYSVVLVSTDLPDGDGFRFTENLKSNPRTAASMVVLFGENLGPNERVQGIRAGATLMLEKPVLISRLMSTVRALIDQELADSIRDPQTQFRSVRGRLSRLTLVDLLRLGARGKRNGILYVTSDPASSGGFVTSGECQGSIFLRAGQVVDARLEHRSPLQALERLMLWDDGVFELIARPVDRENVVGQEVRTILLEATHRMEEWSRLRASLPPLDARLAVDYELLTEESNDSGDDLKRMLQGFDAGQTLIQVVDASDRDSILVLEEIAALYRDGVLGRVERKREVTGLHRIPTGLRIGSDEQTPRPGDYAPRPLPPAVRKTQPAARAVVRAPVSATLSPLAPREPRTDPASLTPPKRPEVACAMDEDTKEQSVVEAAFFDDASSIVELPRGMRRAGSLVTAAGLAAAAALGGWLWVTHPEYFSLGQSGTIQSGEVEVVTGKPSEGTSAAPAAVAQAKPAPTAVAADPESSVALHEAEPKTEPPKSPAENEANAAAPTPPAAEASKEQAVAQAPIAVIDAPTKQALPEAKVASQEASRSSRSRRSEPKRSQPQSEPAPATEPDDETRVVDASEIRNWLKEAESALPEGRLSWAQRNFRKVLKREPEHAAAHSGLAMVLSELGKNDEAEREAQAALRLDPNQARAHLVLGFVAMNRNDLNGARKAYTRYLEVAPNAPGSDGIRKILDQIR